MLGISITVSYGKSGGILSKMTKGQACTVPQLKLGLWQDQAPERNYFPETMSFQLTELLLGLFWCMVVQILVFIFADVVIYVTTTKGLRSISAEERS